MKLSGSDDIRVALISNTRKLTDNTMSDQAQIVGDVDGRQCIIVSWTYYLGSKASDVLFAFSNFLFPISG